MPRTYAAALRAKIEKFAEDPAARHSAAKSFGGNIGRIRHGDWRALYRIDAEHGAVTIEAVKHRREVYR